MLFTTASTSSSWNCGEPFGNRRERLHRLRPARGSVSRQPPGDRPAGLFRLPPAAGGPPAGRAPLDRDGAFSGCALLQALTLPAGLETLGRSPFEGCVNLQLRVSPRSRRFSAVDGVLYNRTLTELLFYPCGRKGAVFTVPPTVQRIGPEAFIGSTGLAALKFPIPSSQSGRRPSPAAPV